MGDFNYICDKCPRTFKLEEFYDKHKKVHELKKQHKCNVCGFVYGAAKGLEGHMKLHTEQEIKNNETSASEPPYNMDFHFLNPRGVLAQATSPVNIKATTPMKREKSSSTEMVINEDSESIGRKAGSGTGNYKVYDSVPNFDKLSPNENGFFSCLICQREFSSINSLKKHTPIHTRAVQHSCDLCGFVFGKKEYLLDHIRKHTGEISPNCEVCGQTFNKSLKLKEHSKLHKNLLADGTSVHEVVPFRCHICREVFQQAIVLGSHLSSAHRDVAWCPLCPQAFQKVYDLKVHMVKTHGKEYMENNFTPEEFADMIRSMTTPRRASQIEIIPTKEPSIIHQMKSNEINKKHPQLHYFDQTKETQILSCQLCSEKFVRQSDFHIHMETIHHIPLSELKSMEPKEGQRNHLYVDSEEPPMITIQPIQVQNRKKRKPGPASKTNAPVENRMIANNNIPPHLDQLDEQGFECKECGKVLQHKQSFLSHMKVIHGNFYGGNKWKGHSSVVDMIIDESAKLSPKKKNSKGGSDANATMCSVCEQVFPNQSSLRNHVVNVHIQGQNHTCDLCGKAFLCQENLDAHIRSKHPNLNKRLQSLRDALGLKPDEDLPHAKRARLTNEPNFLLSSDKHVKETDELPRVNGLSRDDTDEIRIEPDNSYEQDPQPVEQAEPSIKDESMEHQTQQQEQNQLQQQQQPQPQHEEEEDDDVRYEPITEAFVFEEQIIHPCYVILPFVQDNDVETLCNRSIGVYYGNEISENLDDEEEGQLTIDERPPTPEQQEQKRDDEETPLSLLHRVAKQQGLSGEELLNKPQPDNGYNAEDIKLDSSVPPGFYPNIGDFSLPFSLSSIWKKKVDILPPETLHQLEMIQKMEEIKQMNASVSEKIHSKPKPACKKNKPSRNTNVNNNTVTKTVSSPTKQDPASTTQVSDYESQIQHDFWPLDCIKCNTLLGNLDNFNIHMNDHWSDDKCCPVCGLLINSKRFNFKQHLKIHTGEKPFTCNICNRSFRQKAHMVKHVTTHRTMPNGGSNNNEMQVSALAVQ